MSRTYSKYLIAALLSVGIAAGCAGDKNKETNTAASVSEPSAQSTAKSGYSGVKSSVSASADNSAEAAEKSYVPAPKVERIVYNFSKVDGTANDVEMALRAAENGNVDTAVSMLQRTSSKSSEAFLAHYNLGVMYERQLNTSGARQAYEAALNAEPKFTPALIQLVRLDIREGNPSAGISKANSYITSNPDVFEHNYAKLEGLIAAKQYDEAISLISSLLKRDEANGKLRYYLAMTEFSRGRYRLAEFIVGEALEIIAEIFLRGRARISYRCGGFAAWHCAQRRHVVPCWQGGYDDALSNDIQRICYGVGRTKIFGFFEGKGLGYGGADEDALHPTSAAILLYRRNARGSGGIY